MGDEGRNIVLRLPREIGAGRFARPETFVPLGRRMTALARGMGDATEGAGCARGFPAHASVACGASGRRLDRRTEAAADPRARPEKLEEKA